MLDFAREVQVADTDGGGVKGAYVYESSQAHGHDFSEADCKLALQWFSEAVTGLTIGAKGDLTWLTEPRQSCWIRPDEGSIVIKGGMLSYAAPHNNEDVADCDNYVGAWYSGGDVEIVESLISFVLKEKAVEQKAYFDSKSGDASFQAEIAAAIADMNALFASV